MLNFAIKIYRIIFMQILFLFIIKIFALYSLFLLFIKFIEFLYYWEILELMCLILTEKLSCKILNNISNSKIQAQQLSRLRILKKIILVNSKIYKSLRYNSGTKSFYLETSWVKYQFLFLFKNKTNKFQNLSENLNFI